MSAPICQFCENHCPRCNSCNRLISQFCQGCGSPLDVQAQPVRPYIAPQEATPSKQGYEQSPHPWMHDPANSSVRDPRPSGSMLPSQVRDQVKPPKGSNLSKVGMVMGIIVACLMVVGLVPCLGWLNWFTLITGGITNIVCWVSVITEKDDPSARNRAVIGLILTFLAVFIGGIRLALGGGCV
jgi:hypothetical protein